MRVAIVHSFYDRSQASGENEVVLAQARALEAAGICVRLFARYTDELSDRRLYPLYAAVGASNIYGPSPHLQDFAPNIVHVHNLFPNWGAKWIGKQASPVVATLHNHRTICSNALLWRDGHDCRDCLEMGSHAAVKNACYRDSKLATVPLAWSSRRRGAHQPVLHDASALVVLNSGSRELYQRMTTTPVYAIPNFVSTPEGVVEPPSQLDRHRYTYVGRVTPEKGLRQLIECLPVGIGLDVIGTGPDLEPSLDAARSGRKDVRSLGLLPHDEVLEHVAASSGLIIPSLWSEGIPTTALEALSVGTPVLVSSHVAAAPDLIRGGAGIEFDPESSDSLRSAFNRLERNGSSMRAAARRLHAERYSASAWTSDMVGLYELMIARQPVEG